MESRDNTLRNAEISTRDVGFNVLINTPRFVSEFEWTHLSTSYTPQQRHVLNYSDASIIGQRNGTGNYLVRFVGLAYSWLNSGTVMASSHGTAGEICEVISSRRSGGTVIPNVLCRKPGGQVVDSRFTDEPFYR